jgi:hypothetical protein
MCVNDEREIINKSNNDKFKADFVISFGRNALP